MITETEWNAMSDEEQALAWLRELSGMIQTAVAQWRSSITPGSSDTLVTPGVFNVIVERKESP